MSESRAPRYYTVEDDNSVSVFGGESLPDPKLGSVTPCFKTVSVQPPHLEWR